MADNQKIPEILLTLNRTDPDGVEACIHIDNEQDEYDFFEVISASVERVDLWIDTFTPAFDLLAPMPALINLNSGKYERTALLPKKNTQALKQYLTTLFHRASGGTDN